MALLHRADLVPSKLELLNVWLPARDWFRGPAGAEVSRVAAARLDDPDGEVGVEVLLVSAGDGPIYHTPLTYRAAPLPDAEAWLLGTAEHSVLGTRWIYDACGDPVYARVLADAIISGGHEADEYFEDADGHREHREPAMRLQGSGIEDGPMPKTLVESVGGALTRITMDTVTLDVVRVPDASVTADGATLTGSWPADGRPFVLAYATALR
jgi:Maltokinase N-terminal cap domain